MDTHKGSQFLQLNHQALDYSVLDLFTLQRLKLKKVPLIRYEILQEIRIYIDDVSTGKIYRMLNKFDQNGLVQVVDEQKQAYQIADKGIKLLGQVQDLINQFGYNVLNYFEKFIPDILNMLEAGEDITLLYDYEQIYELPFMQLINTNTGKLHLLTQEEDFAYYQNVIPDLIHTRCTDRIIREPDQFFDTVVCVFHDDIIVLLEEFYRVLKPNGQLIVVETDASNAIHFVHKVLFEQFAPSFLKKKKRPLQLNNLDDSKWIHSQTKNLEGLLLIKLTKKGT